jgi:hypothetical protein
VIEGKEVMVNRSVRQFQRNEPVLLRSNARDKPNFRAGTRGPLPGPSGPPLPGRLCKTKPIPGYAGRDGTWGTGTNAPNKPNLGRGHVRGKSCMGKELWWIIHP